MEVELFAQSTSIGMISCDEIIHFAHLFSEIQPIMVKIFKKVHIRDYQEITKIGVKIWDKNLGSLS